MTATAELNTVQPIPQREFELLQQWFEHASEPVFYQDTEQRLLWCNDSFKKDFAPDSTPQVVGQTIDQLLPEAVAEALREGNKTLTAGRLVSSEISGLSDPSGQAITVQATQIPVNIEQEMVGSLCFLRQQEMAANHFDLAANLLENAPDCIYFKDRQSKFVRASEFLAAHLGLDCAQDLEGKSDFDFFEEKYARAAFAAEQSIINGGAPLLAVEEKEVLSNGNVRWILASKMPWHARDGKILGTFGISKDITEQKKTERELSELHEQLLATARQAGMAEVANNVLHNIGNVLNSVGVAASMTVEKIRKLKCPALEKACELLQQHADEPGFLVDNSKGKQLPAYLSALATSFSKAQDGLLTEVNTLVNHITHINEILRTQQSFAGGMRYTESVHVSELIEDSIRMNVDGLRRHEVTLTKRIGKDPQLETDKHKVLQILVNLVRNAKNACDESDTADKQIELQVEAVDSNFIDIHVVDNGMGILEENLDKIFNHGFTTRKEGHGFGLHSAANAATELGGSLTAHSDGPGKGARFTLRLPVTPPSSQ